MRKLVYQMMISSNGRMDDPFAWISDVRDDQYAEIDRFYEGFDTLLVGHATYHEMFGYWPGAETEEGGTEVNKRMARRMNSVKKYVVSAAKETTALEWNNAELVLSHSDQEFLALSERLKSQPGRDIHCLVQTAVRLGLIDEYRLFVYPTVSHGRTWFDDMKQQQGLELIGSKTFSNGVVGLVLRPKAGAESKRPAHFTEVLS